MQLKTERFEMRLDSRTLERVDAWRARQSDLPSRAEAVINEKSFDALR